MAGVKKRPRLPHSEEPSCSSETHLLVELVSADLGLTVHLRKLLTAEGLELIHASGPDCAADLARKYRPDCVLVDVEPENKGEAMLDALLSHVAVSERPVVLLTNSDALYETYRNRVASRIKRGFRKSSLLSGIRYAVDPSMDDTKALGNAILCVDDDKEIVEFIRVCLETEGYSVACCASGDEAVRRAKGREYRLVLLDLTMPGMDGWETCRRIKAEPGLAGIKVYLITAKPIDGTSPELHDSAVDGYLLKPFKPDDLLQVVQGFMGSTDKKEA
jgi:CheY-like chemotaxis protein